MSMNLDSRMIACLGAVPALVASSALAVPLVTINSKTFDLAQFSGASVTYRTNADGGQVTFDGKLWDNEVGVDLFTLGELASGQFGSDPGDQVSLNNRSTPDWLQLNYGTPQPVLAGAEFVVFEITSSSSGVDLEGTSWKIGFNGGTPVAVNPLDVSHFPGPNGVEDTNMAVLDLADFGLNPGDSISTVYIENIDSGSGTSDPDFIFAGLTNVPAPAPLALLGMGMAGLARRRRA